MLGELIGEFKGKVTGVRILPEGKTEMSIHGSGKIIGIDATYASTGVFTHFDNNVLMEVGNGLITTIDQFCSNEHYANKCFHWKRTSSLFQRCNLLFH